MAGRRTIIPVSDWQPDKKKMAADLRLEAARLEEEAKRCRAAADILDPKTDEAREEQQRKLKGRRR